MITFIFFFSPTKLVWLNASVCECGSIDYHVKTSRNISLIKFKTSSVTNLKSFLNIISVSLIIRCYNVSCLLDKIALFFFLFATIHF